MWWVTWLKTGLRARTPQTRAGEGARRATSSSSSSMMEARRKESTVELAALGKFGKFRALWLKPLLNVGDDVAHSFSGKISAPHLVCKLSFSRRPASLHQRGRPAPPRTTHDTASLALNDRRQQGGGGFVGEVREGRLGAHEPPSSPALAFPAPCSLAYPPPPTCSHPQPQSLRAHVPLARALASPAQSLRAHVPPACALASPAQSLHAHVPAACALASSAACTLASPAPCALAYQPPTYALASLAVALARSWTSALRSAHVRTSHLRARAPATYGLASPALALACARSSPCALAYETPAC
ncbi:hypothetical protein PLICRDRAFT_180391 [Plicaturopsis crispa FD-325 SS-3]|uniref:Uncharacterized protein n=1 Tax=Plicaturopsis crispa FD-325 SS-3 TaxID=944288 RepID=A0A0C9SQ94_PLICR|nr:hypothetical protein PLICRDRAFT_180391 [Plicaturopsis crispa FD-325 SS-3]